MKGLEARKENLKEMGLSEKFQPKTSELGLPELITRSILGSVWELIAPGPRLCTVSAEQNSARTDRKMVSMLDLLRSS